MFADASWGEDDLFVEMQRLQGARIMFHSDVEGIALHVQHGKNLSHSLAQTAMPPEWLLSSPLASLISRGALTSYVSPQPPTTPSSAPSVATPNAAAAASSSASVAILAAAPAALASSRGVLLLGTEEVTAVESYTTWRGDWAKGIDAERKQLAAARSVGRRETNRNSPWTLQQHAKIQQVGEKCVFGFVTVVFDQTWNPEPSLSGKLQAQLYSMPHYLTTSLLTTPLPHYLTTHYSLTH